MDYSKLDREPLPAPFEKVDEDQQTRFRELEDRLDRLLGRVRGPCTVVRSDRQAPSTSANSASNSVNNSINRAPSPTQSAGKSWLLPSEKEAPRASPTVEKVEKVEAPKERSATPRVEEAEAANPEAAIDVTPTRGTSESTSADASPSSNQDENGKYGTVKSLKNQREIDFSVKFVEKRHKKSPGTTA